MELKIKVPESLYEIPLSSYVEFLKVQENSNDEEFIAHKFLSIFLGIELKEVLKVRATDINRVVQKVATVLKQKPDFTKTFTLNGVEFGFHPDLENMTFGEYIDVESNIFSWENMHIALAVLYRPITKKFKDTYEIEEYKAKPEYAEFMKILPMGYALGVSVFFYRLEKELLQVMENYLVEGTKEMIMEGATVPRKFSARNGAGIIQSIDSVKTVLSILKKSRDYPYIRPSLFYFTKLKETA